MPFYFYLYKVWCIISYVSPIFDWDRLVLKGVQSKENEDFGNIIAINDQNIIIMMGRHEYKLAKSFVDYYNGSEVFLKIPLSEMYQKEIKL